MIPVQQLRCKPKPTQKPTLSLSFQLFAVGACPITCPTLLMNTTSTAQYLPQISLSNIVFESPSSKMTQRKSQSTHPAAAPKISCRLALVKKLNTPENARVNSSRIPMIITVSGPDRPGLMVHRCHST